MADLTSVLEIDVRDEQFKQAQAELDSFLSKLQEASKLSGMIGSSKAVAMRPGIGGPKTQMDDFAKSLKDATSKTNLFGVQLAKTTTGIAIDSGKKLTNAFVSLTKSIVGTGGLIAGVTSMATLAGIIRTSAGTQQKAFMANIFGINPNDIGRMRSTWGQIADVGGVLHALEQERENPASLAMAQLGYTPGQAKQANVLDIFDRLTDKMEEIVRSPLGVTETAIKAHGLEGIIDLDTLKRLRNLGPAGIAQLRERDVQYRRETQLQDPKEWQRFASEIGLRKLRLETTFQNALTKLLDPILKVMDALREKFMEGAKGGLSGIIDKVAIGLGKFEDALKTDKWESFWEFVKESASQAFGAIGSMISAAFPKQIAKLNEFMDSFSSLSASVREIAESFRDLRVFLHAIMHPGETLSAVKAIGGAVSQDASGMMDKWHEFKKQHGIPTLRPGDIRSAIQKASEDFNIDPSLIERVIGAESSGKSGAVSSKGAMGLMQTMPGTFKEMGGTDPFNPEQSIYFGTKYLRQMMDMFGQDPELALAAYNAGPGNVKKYGGKVPPFKETQDYVAKILGKSKSAYRGNVSAGQMDTSSMMSAAMQRNSPVWAMDKTVRVKIDNKHSSADLSIQGARMYGNSYASGK
jgi:Transglycosylase SLT domain